MNCNDCGGFLPNGCTCSSFGGRNPNPQAAAAQPGARTVLARVKTDAPGSTGELALHMSPAEFAFLLEFARQWNRHNSGHAQPWITVDKL